MGMHIGLLAVKGDVDRLIESVAEAWPNLEPAAVGGPFSIGDEAWQWEKQHSKRVTVNEWSLNNPGAEVLFFYASGSWAVLLDSSYVRASDNRALERLSALFGTAIAFVVESAGGTAFFSCHEKGALRREISSTDGEVNTQGEPLPEEKTGYGQSYYMNETEELMRSFGVNFDEGVFQKTKAIQYIDREDYSGLRRASSPHKKKPWWQFW